MQTGQLNSIQLTVLGRNHSFLDSLKEEFEHYTEKETSDSDETFIYTFETEWKCERTIKKRSFDTVFLDSNTKTILTDHLDTFYSREEWYEKRGIPYQTGILLYGEPGTGKTSIVRALAGKYNKRLCIIQAAQLTELANALRTLPLDSFIVIEDIDVNSIIHTREKNTGVRPREENIVEADSSAKVCLSEILNALDGIISVRGRVLFLTTNHIEVLDKAFIRPGRVDLSVNISYTTLEAFKEFVRVFYVDKLKPGETLALESLREIKKVTIAQLQNDFMSGLEAEEMIAKYALMQSDFITAHNLPAKAAG
jgi:chaperone BCS1